MSNGNELIEMLLKSFTTTMSMLGQLLGDEDLPLPVRLFRLAHCPTPSGLRDT